MDPPRHILITGPPGCGKTTFLVRLAAQVAFLHPAGFYTEEIRISGVRQGFRLESLDGREALLAHVRSRSEKRVGRYGVEVSAFESFLEKLDVGKTDSPLILIDEIGKMECFSHSFIDLIRELLDSGRMVVATVALKGAGFIAEVKQRKDCGLVKLSPSFREEQGQVLARLIADRFKVSAGKTV